MAAPKTIPTWGLIVGIIGALILGAIIMYALANKVTKDKTGKSLMDIKKMNDYVPASNTTTTTTPGTGGSQPGTGGTTNTPSGDR